jgi:hypothetical protein
VGDRPVYIISSCCLRSGGFEVTNADDGLLALNTQDELFLLDIDIKVFSFEITGDFDSNIKVANCLGPFVW